MNIKDLQYFVKLVELKNYSETARFFQLSQPTISYAIKRLETEQAAKLLTYSNMHQLQLTEAGETLLLHAKIILQEANLISTDIENLKRHRLKVGLPPIITQYLLRQDKYFDIFTQYLNKIDSYASDSIDLAARLSEGYLDLSLIGSAQPIVDANLVSYELFKQHFKIVVSTNSPLAKLNRISLSELVDQKFILLDEISSHQSIFNQLISSYHFQPNILFQSSNYNTVLRLIQKNCGIGFLTETVMSAGYSGLKVLDLVEAHNIYFRINLAYRRDMWKNSEFDQAIQKIIKM